MADTVTSQTITDVSGSKTVMKFTNFSDGTGESLVTKVDASALNHASSSTKIARVIYPDLQTPAIQIANNASSPTGDILFSTHNFVANDSYTVILEVR